VHSKPIAALTHARVEAGACCTPGLFKSLSPGERKGSKLNVVYVPEGHGPTLQFVGPEPLGIDDLRVFQGLLGAASISEDGVWTTLDHDSQSTPGRALRDGLGADLAVREDQIAVAVDIAIAVVVRVSYARLAAEIGYANVRDKSTIKDSIRRLFLVTVFKTQDGKTLGSRLLSRYEADDAREEICVAINPTMAAAVLGNAHFLRVNLTEARMLAAPAARLIHQRLSWINQGSSGTVSLRKLCDYAYPPAAADELKRRAGVEALKAADRRRSLLALAGQADEAQAAKARAELAALDRALTIDPKKAEKERADRTQRKHVGLVREALNELIALGWRVVENGKNFKISRPKAGFVIEMVAMV